MAGEVCLGCVRFVAERSGMVWKIEAGEAQQGQEGAFWYVKERQEGRGDAWRVEECFVIAW